MRYILVVAFLTLCNSAAAEDFVGVTMRWDWTTYHFETKKSWSHSITVTMTNNAVRIEGYPVLRNKVAVVTNKAGIRDEMSVVLDKNGFTYTAKQSSGFRSKVVARIKNESCSVSANSNIWKATVVCSVISRGEGWKAKDNPTACASVADAITDMKRLLADDNCRNQSKIITIGKSIKGAGCRARQKEVDALIGKASARRCVADPTSPVGVRG